MKKSLIALAFMMSLSAVGGLSTSATALGLTDILEAGKGHLKDLGDRWKHEDEYIGGIEINSADFREDDPGRDPIHWADGTASLVDMGDSVFIQLDDNFRSGPAPDLYLYVANQRVYDERSFWDAETIEVAKLKSGSGAQFYELPVDLNSENHIELVVWCKRFGAYIGAVTLWKS